MNQKIFDEDMEYVLIDKCIPWNRLKGSKILITGATGLICSTLVKAILYANIKLSLKIEIWCIIRDVNKARKIFVNENDNDALHLLEEPIDLPIHCEESFDYVIHGACPTESSFFVEHPVEVIDFAYRGTRNLLDKALRDSSKGFLYLSSMEAFGNVSEERVLRELDLGDIDLSNVRSSYSESKRMCELLCKSFASEFGLHTMSIRLSQTFGPGVLKNDKRVFAMMARCAMNEEDIVLLTKGTSKHPYLYTAQAVTAVLCVLLNGKTGETYTAANPDTYCSIYEMACLVAEKIADGRISVKIQENADNKKYPPAGFLNLSIDKISGLGWKPHGSLVEIYERMIACMEE